MASYPRYSNPYDKARQKANEGFSSYNPKTGTLTSGTQSYSVAPEKASAMLQQVENKEKWTLNKRTSNSNNKASEQVNLSNSMESAPYELTSTEENKPLEKKDNSKELNRRQLQEAYLYSQAQERTKDRDETLAFSPEIEQTAFKFGVNKELYSVIEPSSQEDVLTAGFNKARQEFRDEVNREQNQVFINGEERTKEFTGKSLKSAGGIVAFGVASAGRGVIKGGATAIKDVVTLQIIPKTTDFLTDLASNPRGVYADIKTEFALNPVEFTAENLAYGVTTGKVFKGIKKGDILRAPISPAYDVPKPGSIRTKLDGFSGIVLGLPDRVGTWIEQNPGLGLNKKGGVNNPFKRIKSKAELRYQSQTGTTKSERIKQSRPAQQGYSAQTFYKKDFYPSGLPYDTRKVVKYTEPNKILETTSTIKTEPVYKEIQRRVYKNNIDNIKGTSGGAYSYEKVKVLDKPSEIVKVKNEITLPRETFFSRVKKRTEQNANNVLLERTKDLSGGIVKYSKNIGGGFILDSAGVVVKQTGKLKIKIDTMLEKRNKANLQEKQVQNKKQTPFNKPLDLVSNINEKGQEVYSQVSEPVNQVVRGFRSQKIRDELIKRVKEKRAKQLEKLQNEKASKEIITGNINILNIRKKQNNIFIDEDIVLAPRVSPEQLARTKTYTRNLPSSEPRLSLSYDTKLDIVGEQKIYPEYKNPYLNLASNPQLEKPSLIFNQDLGISQAPDINQDLGIIQEQETSQEQKIYPDIITDTTSKTKRRRTTQAPIIINPIPNTTEITRPQAPITPKIPVKNITTPLKPNRTQERQIPIIKPRVEENKYKFSGFDVLVRKKGKFIKINKGALSRIEALNLGAYKVGTTSSASFKIAPSKFSTREYFKGTGNFIDFYSKGNIFIEKKTRRIKSIGELQEITFKGIQANKNKNFWRGIK